MYRNNGTAKRCRAIQEQRPNVGTTGTSLLHDSAVPTKQEPQFGVLRQKGDKCCPTHPAALTWHFVAVGSFCCENWPRRKDVFCKRKSFAVNSQLHAVPSLECHSAFQKQPRRLQFRVDSDGEFVEKPSRGHCCRSLCLGVNNITVTFGL